MFTRKDIRFFFSAIVLLLAGYFCIAFDPAENGFGMTTLWIAPPLLVAGFILPVIGIIGYPALMQWCSFPSLRINRWKHLIGFLAFVIALSTYMITSEPTASLWDCSEFIASAFKLQVPHTPGNPLLLLFGRIFALLSLNDVTTVAHHINLMSALFSALTVYLVYYLTCYFGSRLIVRSSTVSSLHVSLAALCASLCLTFSDTFWFSAVEAETYGPACFFLVLIVALILKGKTVEEPLRSRFMVLIFYIAGLSYCIHPMCILTLPVLPFAWYVQRRKLTFINVLLPAMAGMIIVFLINRFIAIGIFELAFYLDLYMVNQLHFPFYSGALVLMALLALVVYTLMKKYPALTTYTWSLVLLVLGFTPYLLLFIRSNHNPPIDENNPENLPLIKAYMNRESYPSSPLLYGPYFDAQVTEVTVKKKIYYPESGQYKVAGTMPEYRYDAARSTFLPRLYSNDADHIESYRKWTGLKANEIPHFTDNLTFLFKYQLGHMYFRYLLWNFGGRASDYQDSDWLRPWDHLHVMNSPAHENKARNQYWMIPFALGLIGMAVQYQRDRKNFYAVALFFLTTGLMLAFYLNSYPVEPRERDYIYVGSYIAFAIWIGLGVLAIATSVSRFRLSFCILTAGILLPAWMCFENYDDHNRAGRTFQIDHARNMLAGCAAHSILFTGGDNDTFPLWYVQEVEGYRTDVRVMVMSYLNTDWYINQLRKAYYQSAPFALTLGEKAYRQYGANDVLYLQESLKEGIDVADYLKLLKEEHKGLRMQSNSGDTYSILPSRTLKLKIDPASLPGEALAGLSSSDTLPSQMELRVTGNYLTKSTLAIADIIASNHWLRPIYFNYTSLNTAGLELSTHVIQEGNLYRLAPLQNQEEGIRMNTALSYKNLIEKSDYSNLADSSLYFNYEDYQARIITPLRGSFNALAIALMNEGDPVTAAKVMNHALQQLYPQHLKPSYTNLQAADILISLGKEDLAKALCVMLFDFHYDLLQANVKERKDADRLDIYLAQQAALMLDKLGEKKYVTLLNDLGLE